MEVPQSDSFLWVSSRLFRSTFECWELKIVRIFLKWQESILFKCNKRWKSSSAETLPWAFGRGWVGKRWEEKNKPPSLTARHTKTKIMKWFTTKVKKQFKLFIDDVSILMCKNGWRSIRKHKICNFKSALKYDLKVEHVLKKTKDESIA